MTQIRLVSGLCLALIIASCGDEGPSDLGTGSVEVTTVSTGQGLDADGYIVEVRGAGTLAIGDNATATFAEAPAGDLEVRLTGLRGNCTVQAPHPRLVRVVAGETSRTHFTVACAYTPLLGRIVFHSRRDDNIDLYSMNADGSDPVRLTNTPPEEREFNAAVSPDGSKILFVNGIGPYDDYNTDYLYVMNADGTNKVRLAPRQGGFIGAPVWSPDGSQIAFHGLIEGNSGFDIWVMNADGSELRNVTNTPDPGEFTPSWSPDGRRILFARDNPPRLEVMSPDGTRQTPFPAPNAYWATWSPDEARIAFLSTLNERTRLFTTNTDGSAPAPLTADDGGFDDIASWSPAGDRLAFIHVVDPDVEVHVINADGTREVAITDNDTFEGIGPQAWGP